LFGRSSRARPMTFECITPSFTYVPASGMNSSITPRRSPGDTNLPLFLSEAFELIQIPFCYYAIDGVERLCVMERVHSLCGMSVVFCGPQ